jgi:predicted DCC family thiol-disulfide oxidoreductase YuxK
MLFQPRHILYDGACGLCRSSLHTIRRLDWMRKTITHDVANGWPELQRLFPRIDRDEALREMHLITQDGRVYRGYDSFRSLAWIFPLAWPILPLLYLPPIPQIGRRMYRRIAASRKTSATCSIHTGQ